MGNVLRDLEALQAIFMEDENSLWRMYSGAFAKGKKVGENMDDDDLESSWEKLHTRLTRYNEGVFTIATMRKSGTNNSGANVHTIKMGTGKSTALVAGPNNVSSQLDNLIKLNQFLGNKSDDEIAGAYDSAKEEFQKDMELERLKIENERLKSGSMFEKVIGTCIEKLPNILEQYFPPNAPAGALGSIGFTDDTKDGAVSFDTTPGQLDLNQLVNDATQLQQLIPDQNVNLVLHKLVQFFAKNPAQGKILLSQL